MVSTHVVISWSGRPVSGPSPASDGPGSSRSAPKSRMICPNFFIIERGAVVQYTFDVIPVSDRALPS
ncbi:hypothetical protein SAV14893_094670 [Streptomyces avermitilis]|uniref:Uncharacterized protein n=1 Tax=Streptomyces avermitilis TaxID=33903 RepID=A0A4D4ME39_STRAX|nr:hypothetical protein SAVMC3_01740 [Streptomyces avermitilis]GDY70074.1 hypothetical protein SAV14893_094670 [Streptomyces avermitilis]